MNRLILECDPPQELIKLLAIFFIRKLILFFFLNDNFKEKKTYLVLMMNINSISASAANRVSVVFTICKVTTILTVIIFGFIRMGQGFN